MDDRITIESPDGAFGAYISRPKTFGQRLADEESITQEAEDAAD
jgi:hypothetical protein